MALKKQLLSSINLYLIASITDYKNHTLLYRRVKTALHEGVKALQLRLKGIGARDSLKLAKEFRKLTKKYGAIFIVNDRPDIAKACSADGIHLGQDDMPLSRARLILGKDKIIGKSTHSLKQALRAQAEGADYIGFGPIFKTRTKPQLKPIGTGSIKLMSEKIDIPFFVLGGINPKNIADVTIAGAGKVAVSDAILLSRDVRSAIKNLQKFL